MASSSSSLSLFLLLSLLLSSEIASGRHLSVHRKPDPKNAAATARWLAAQNSWGVLRFHLCSKLTTFFLGFRLNLDLFRFVISFSLR